VRSFEMDCTWGIRIDRFETLRSDRIARPALTLGLRAHAALFGRRGCSIDFLSRLKPVMEEVGSRWFKS